MIYSSVHTLALVDHFDGFMYSHKKKTRSCFHYENVERHLSRKVLRHVETYDFRIVVRTTQSQGNPSTTNILVLAYKLWKLNNPKNDSRANIQRSWYRLRGYLNYKDQKHIWAFLICYNLYFGYMPQLTLPLKQNFLYKEILNCAFFHYRTFYWLVIKSRIPNVQDANAHALVSNWIKKGNISP